MYSRRCGCESWVSSARRGGIFVGRHLRRRKHWVGDWFGDRSGEGVIARAAGVCSYVIPTCAVLVFVYRALWMKVHTVFCCLSGEKSCTEFNNPCTKFNVRFEIINPGGTAA